MGIEKTKTTKSNGKDPVKVIRNGAVAASIWQRQTSTGFEYLDFSLSRSWKLKSGDKEGYSSNFFAANEEAILDVVTKAADYIRKNSVEPAAANGQSDEAGSTMNPSE
jgi:hypothetical protein